MRESARNRRKRLGLCIDCETPNVSHGNNFKLCDICFCKRQEIKKKHHIETLKKQTTNRKAIRIKAMQIISGTEHPVCKNCGCNDMHVLEINHINYNGKKDYKPCGIRRTTSEFYKDIVKGKRNHDDLNILCKVCNNKYTAELKSKGEWQVTWMELGCYVCGDVSHEYAIMNARWGYYSNKDGVISKCILCESCFAKVQDFIVNTLKGKVREISFD